MHNELTRRFFFGAAAGAAAGGRLLVGQELQVPGVVVHEPVFPIANRSRVAVVAGKERRQMVHDALLAVERDILPVLKQKKYVVIKPNNVSTVNQLAATHADTLRGIIDFLAPRFKGPVVVAEASAGNTPEGYQNFGYVKIPKDYPSRNISLVDLSTEGKYEVIPLLTENLHVQPVRLAARLCDPDAYVICSAILKTHNTVIATLSVKNMVLGAPLRSAPGIKPVWNDKRKYHGGIRQTHYNMMLTAQKLKPFWGATLIDGWEGMEGNGPGSGTPVESRIAIASTDYIAADRVAVECMGINPAWMGYLNYCAQVGLGNFDIAKIDVQGAKIAEVKKSYRLHKDIERELQWMGPLNELPPKLG
jgi:uncharacterized protein (DUF362 family)